MNKLSKFINNPWIAYVFAAGYGLTNWVPDEPHLKAMIGGRLVKSSILKIQRHSMKSFSGLNCMIRTPFITL